MVNSITKFGGACIIFTLLATSTVLSQSYQNTEYRNISVALHGGATLGDVNDANYFLSSDFSVNIENTATIGASLQYALTPMWSLDLGYRYTNIKGRSQLFESDVNLITLKNIINLNQLLSINRVSNRINPFISAGVGYDLFTYRGGDESFSNQNSSYNAGVGITFKASNTIDLFSHYEYHMASNDTDNDPDGFGSDLINSLTGGIRVNFGKKGTPHPSWRPVPVEVSSSDYNRFMSQSRIIDNLERKIDEIAQRQKEKEQKYDRIVDKQSSEIDSLKARMDHLNGHADKLVNALTEYQRETKDIKVDTKTGFAESLPGGHYVQIFATYHLESAQEVREYVLQNLRDVVQDSEQNIFIIQRKKFYEVMIGVFDNYQQAQNVQEVMRQIHDDAYVITFPRPVNLKPDFEGLKVLDENILVEQQSE
jgi:opacity protein-like surface antigen/predicted transcriptional regulator